MARRPDPPALAQLAREHLVRARESKRRDAPVETVLWASMAAEMAIEASAMSRGVDTRHDHFRRASLARRLHEEGLIDDDLGSLLTRLNNERKHAVYEAREPDLRGRSWEDVLAAVETLVAAAERATSVSTEGLSPPPPPGGSAPRRRP